MEAISLLLATLFDELLHFLIGPLPFALVATEYESEAGNEVVVFEYFGVKEYLLLFLDIIKRHDINFFLLFFSLRLFVNFLL